MYGVVAMVFFFFFKQKTAYEMRISDWSSDVCSSDLSHGQRRRRHAAGDHGPQTQKAADAAGGHGQWYQGGGEGNPRRERESSVTPAPASLAPHESPIRPDCSSSLANGLPPPTSRFGRNGRTPRPARPSDADAHRRCRSARLACHPTAYALPTGT